MGLSTNHKIDFHTPKILYLRIIILHQVSVEKKLICYELVMNNPY